MPRRTNEKNNEDVMDSLSSLDQSYLPAIYRVFYISAIFYVYESNIAGEDFLCIREGENASQSISENNPIVFDVFPTIHKTIFNLTLQEVVGVYKYMAKLVMTGNLQFQFRFYILK